MVFPSISGFLGEGTECIDVLFIFCVTLLEWMLVLRIGSKSQSRRWTFIYVVVDPDLHVAVQNTTPAAGKDNWKDNCALPDLKGKGIFLLMGSSVR